jgi:hypothetical protein
MNENEITKIAPQHTPGRENRELPSDRIATYANVPGNGKSTFRIITIERECACGAAVISRKLSDILGWKLWDQLLAQELADSIRSDISTAERQGPRADDHFRHLAKVFLRGSYERIAPLYDCPFVDATHMVAIMQRVSDRIAREGNAVVLGRGAPGFFQNRNDTFHIFLYAPREERIRRLIAHGKSEADAEVVEAIDREREAFVKQYFGAHWPTRSFYDLMINTAIGEENVISTILHAMLRVDEGRRSTDPAS